MVKVEMIKKDDCSSEDPYDLDNACNDEKDATRI
jgi:hypothetical protein